MDPTLMWALLVIGGPVLLAGALALSKLRTMKQTRREDPNTPADDPSRGM